MKKAMMVAFALIVSMTPAWPAQDAGKMPGPEKEHAWLKQFIGEWESMAEGKMPDGQTMKCKGTMNNRMLGEFWVIGDIRGDMAGVPMVAVQTIGFNSKTKKYVGSWVDSVMNHMWTYEGETSADGKTLTLNAEGPSMTDEGKMAKYQDIYTFQSKDHIAMKSNCQGKDGKWATFMTSEIRRKK